ESVVAFAPCGVVMHFVFHEYADHDRYPPLVGLNIHASYSVPSSSGTAPGSADFGSKDDAEVDRVDDFGLRVNSSVRRTKTIAAINMRATTHRRGAVVPYMSQS